MDIKRITLPETFSFEHHEWFRDECKQALRYARKIELVCDRVKFLDSAALGMIAMLQKSLNEHHSKEIVVSEPTAYCDEILSLANMYEKYVVRDVIA
ncbi:hypothetical protein MGA5115_03273 [Marinomonas gallaica]|uniref:MlaB-like STAS domain-containing protein n=1 Tax=Marinomonas gallaica TaxID=1806667 RepID=A0A1C3JVJ4_9GAMM|nr:STAS domain-containing protein [Marinomonas gallaica]SBT19112.1 hypothetical protein MGA5115_03273 [Marinomonas gallaica]SBT20813.1 hypothetical protein MGA5116_01400 [Marinomonas gallaica]